MLWGWFMRKKHSGTRDELCAQNGLFARMWQDYQASMAFIRLSSFLSTSRSCFSNSGIVVLS